MGVSTNAILFFGFCWDDECDLLAEFVKDDGDTPEWPDIVLRKRGVVNPWDSYPNAEMAAILDYRQRSSAGSAWVEANRAAIDAWDDAMHAVQAEFGCGIGTHCSGDCSMPYVFVNDSAAMARRGCPEKIEQHQLKIDYTWHAMLDRFMTELGIDKPDGQDAPAWWLVSYWG